MKLSDNQELRVPPHNLEAERSVLGAILLDDSGKQFRDIAGIINANDFYKERHRIIWQTMSRLDEVGIPIDTITLNNYLSQNGEEEIVGGIIYLSSLLEGTPTIANAIYHAQIIKEKSTKRKYIALSSKMRDAGYDDQEDIQNLIEDADRGLTSLRENVLSDFQTTAELMPEIQDEIKEYHDNPQGVRGLSTGYVGLDKILGGLYGGDMIIIAGRPSTGKTSLALNFMENISMDQNATSAILSIEMTRQQIMHRLIASRAKLQWQYIQKGSFDIATLERIKKAQEEVKKAPIKIADSVIGLADLNAKAHKAKAKYNAKIFLIDYLQLLRMSGDERRIYHIDSTQRMFAMFSNEIKNTAKDTRMPVVLLSQLSREVEKRRHKRPQLSDLKETGAMEQDADVVIFIYQKEEEVSGNKDYWETEIIVAKNRNGPRGSFEMYFYPKITRFEERAIDIGGFA